MSSSKEGMVLQRTKQASLLLSSASSGSASSFRQLPERRASQKAFASPAVLAMMHAPAGRLLCIW